MDLDRLLAELMRERDLIDDAIAHLERLPSATHGGSSTPRGRARSNQAPAKTRAAGGDLD